MSGSLGVPSKRMMKMASGWLARVVNILFRPRLDGVEHLPAEGPFLLVSNHNAGIALAEIFSIVTCWVTRFGQSRPLAGFAHPLAFKIWPATVTMRHLGSIPSGYNAAYTALDAGVSVLVFPGGDFDSFRPVWQARKVSFNGRRGFLRIAREAGVPIVPMGIHGSHYTAPLLFRSEFWAWLLVLPRLAGLKRWGLSALGLMGAVALAFAPWSWPVRILAIWAWLVSPFTLLPWVPWTIRMRIGPMMPPESLFDGCGDEDELWRALSRVEYAIEALVRSEERHDHTTV
ncbi:MAG: 1-acyl-sn-glycerol-3-phosphate acyltransferase [Bradymonadia bacterium]